MWQGCCTEGVFQLVIPESRILPRLALKKSPLPTNYQLIKLQHIYMVNPHQKVRQRIIEHGTLGTILTQLLPIVSSTIIQSTKFMTTHIKMKNNSTRISANEDSSSRTHSNPRISPWLVSTELECKFPSHYPTETLRCSASWTLNLQSSTNWCKINEASGDVPSGR